MKTSELQSRAKAALELQKRAKTAAETLLAINGQIKSQDDNQITEGETMKVEGNAYVIKSDAVPANVVEGSEAVRSLGGGVKARIVKTKAGKTVVESFMFDRDRFTQEGAARWIEKHENSILEACRKVQEAAPLGSFVDITLRAQRALNAWDYFNGRYCYISWMFPEYCVVECSDQLYKVPFSDVDGRIVFGEPEKVDMAFVVKESEAQNERLEARQKPDGEIDFVSEGVSIKEADDDKREVVAVLIEAGTNYSKRRHYPKQTIKEAAPLFSGLKMYIDHPTAAQDREKPERSIRDWVSTIEKSWYEDGKAMGLIKVHDDWLWSKLKEDKVFRAQIGISINASGKRHTKVIEGQNMEVIEEIVSPKSVDWVTEPGARGRVEYLVESQSRKEDSEMLKTVKLEEVKKERPDLIESIETELRAKIQAENEVKIQEAVKAGIAKGLKDHDEKVKEAKTTLEKIRAKVKAIAESSKLPKRAIGTFIERFMSQNGDMTEDDVEKRVKEAVEAEVKYLTEAGVSGIKVGVASGKTEEVKETSGPVASPAFLGRIGLGEKKDDAK